MKYSTIIKFYSIKEALEFFSNHRTYVYLSCFDDSYYLYNDKKAFDNLKKDLSHLLETIKD